MTSTLMMLSAAELHDLRRKMCTGILSWASQPGMIGTADSGHYSMLTGLPTPDFNLVIVDSGDQAPLAAGLRDIAAVGAPALLALAAEGATHAGSLSAEWQLVGSMPIMATEVHADGRPDARVRRATTEDTPAVGAAWAMAYGFPPEVAHQAAQLLHRADDRSRIWLLEHDGEVVSAVVSTHVDDVVAIWAMATPPDHCRKGYGRALLTTVLTHAAAAGANVGLLGATEAGYPLYESTGWRTIEHWTLAASGASAQFH